ncbi:MAG: hypothetical protein J6T16_00415 [Opitutales bacterium]|nr:hypothetical protein [Opitutales bacterium]
MKSEKIITVERNGNASLTLKCDGQKETFYGFTRRAAIALFKQRIGDFKFLIVNL